MDEAHYASNFYYRHDATQIPDEEAGLLMDNFDEFTYGSEDVKTSIKKGSGTLMRAGSRGMGVVRNWVNVYGPGLVVMLAAADASSLVTSAELGKEWGYALVFWEVILTYPLYLVQELTVRLGASTKLGHAQLIRYKYGPNVAWFCVIVVIITCIASVVVQLAAIIGICASIGLDPATTCSFLVSVIVLITVGGYSESLEKVCLGLGLCELVFVVAMVMSHPSPVDIAVGITHSVDLKDRSFSYLLAAYVGSVLNPWMMYYEQSAVVDKSLKVEEVPAGRKDTFFGACLCQGICCAVTLTTAARVWDGVYAEHPGGSGSFKDLGELAVALSPFGTEMGKKVVFLGFLGASLNAMVVVALTAVFALAEVAGMKEGKKSFLQHTVSEQPMLYAAFILVLVLGTVISLQDVDMLTLNMTANILNALLLPIALLFLVSLASDPELVPECLLLKGWKKFEISAILLILSVGSIASFIASFW